MNNKFKLRKLKEKDAMLMYEWMHDDSVVENLKADFKSKTIVDCKNFIRESLEDKENVHYAIVNELDEYLGTVSLKDINYADLSAEFAITIRKSAMGTGCSAYAIKEIIEKAFNEFNLINVYWYVDKKNIRAIKFYDKNNYKRIDFNDIINICNNAKNNYDENYIWYIKTK
jgi:diamine N-acetyltransferase